MARGVVDGLGPGEGVEEVEAVRELALELGLEGVIVEEAAGEGRLDVAEALDGPAGIDRQILAGLIDAGGVEVAEDHHVAAEGADVAEVEDEARGDLPLDGEVGALHRGRGQAEGDLVGADGVGAHVGDVEEVVREAALKGQEAGGRVVAAGGGAEGLPAAGDGRGDLVDVRVEDERQVVGEQVFAAHAVEVQVADAEGGAEDRLIVERIGGADAGGEVVAVGVDEGAVAEGAVLGEDHGVGGRVEVGQAVGAFPLRGGELVAEADVQREAARDFVVVLEVEEVHPLAVVNDGRRVELIGGAGAEQVVGDELAVVVGRAGGLREAAGEAAGAVLGVEVIDVGIDALVLVAGFEAVFAEDLGIVDFGVDDEGVLELGVRALDADGGESIDAGAHDAAGEAGIVRDVGDAEAVADGGGADEHGELAAFGAGDAGADFDERGGVDGVGAADGHLFVADADGAVGVAAGGAGDGGRFEVVHQPVAVAGEGGPLVVEVLVVADVAFVVLVGAAGLGFEVIADAKRAGAGAVGRGQVGEDFAGRAGDGAGGDNTVRVDFAGVGVADGDAEVALAHGERGKRGVGDGAADAAVAFVVAEDEHLVFDERSAHGGAELILDQRGLLIVDGLEEAGGVERGVAQVLPDGGVEFVGAAADGGVDDSAAGAAEFGREVVGFEAKLLDGVRGDLDDLIGEALVRGAVGVVVDAVDDEVILRTAHAVDVEGGVARVGDAAAADAGGEQGEVGVGAAVEREVDDLLGADDGAAGAGVGFQHLGGGVDGNAFGGGADFELEVDALAGVDGDFELLRDRGFEAGGFGGDLVAASADRQELVGAGGVGLGGGFDAGAHVGEFQLGFGDAEARGVADEAEDGGRVKLGREGKGREGQQTKQKSTHRLHHRSA